MPTQAIGHTLYATNVPVYIVNIYCSLKQRSSVKLKHGQLLGCFRVCTADTTQTCSQIKACLCIYIYIQFLNLLIPACTFN